jgi:hypothetical protein
MEQLLFKAGLDPSRGSVLSESRTFAISGE